MNTNATPENPTGLNPENSEANTAPQSAPQPSPVASAEQLPESPVGNPAAMQAQPGGSIANVRPGATVPSAPDEAAQAENPDYITLTDGSVAHVTKQRGNIIPLARRLQSEKHDFNDILAAMSTLVDGRPITIEELYNMDLKDTLSIIGRFNEKNG